MLLVIPVVVSEVISVVGVMEIAPLRVIVGFAPLLRMVNVMLLMILTVTLDVISYCKWAKSRFAQHASIFLCIMYATCFIICLAGLPRFASILLGIASYQLLLQVLSETVMLMIKVVVRRVGAR